MSPNYPPNYRRFMSFSPGYMLHESACLSGSPVDFLGRSEGFTLRYVTRPETGATLKPESAPVLEEIAQALEDNPGWKLTVEGHTDNIGGDASI
ncbi:MAG: hypothetical protein QOH35_5264 [Acidobacteriaceae bacterium]|jgi:hypothetical protein|nr:hypothetical protein [Acidobacteriaceae bacterium]